jgi:SAM-dependent methyltransferase
MDEATIRRLNAINREFYRATADEFDRTRGSAWPGWERLLPYLNIPLSVLDVGGGNGRFGVFLWERLVDRRQSPVASATQHLIVYHGQDSNPTLLNRARASLANYPGLEFQLEERDIIENPPDSGAYDLVVLFGVLHHVPGYEHRQDFMRGLAKRVKAGGWLVFTAWRFYEYERFRERFVPWPEDIPVEPHDYLLDWRRGRVSLRYCHYIDDSEHTALVAAAGLAEVLTYRADGQDRATNCYSLLQKPRNL